MSGRQRSVEFLTSDPLDVLVIGGGIVGAAVARDAAMRGLRTALVEQGDFASGTSSRSSRLLHGGIRYLAQGRIGLVREASLEKAVLHRIAPHLADPLPFVFPVYRGNRHWKLWQLRIGVRLYDLLCSGRNLGRSMSLSRDDCLKRTPGLERDGLSGAVRYFDGLTSDARLVLDTLRSAARHGAAVLNYCRLTGAERDLGNGHWSCRVDDVCANAPLEVAARAVVNATGPWAERLPHSAVKLRLTKGIHLVVDRARLPVSEAVVMTDGSRVLFAIPWGGRTIAGTTDTDYDGPLDDIRATAEDVDSVLEVVRRFFPECALTPADVIRTWAGVRPLIADPRGRPSDISRSHRIESPEPGWWDVSGGKLTTCRLMAEQTVDRLARAAGWKLPACATEGEPLCPNGGDPFSGVLPPAFGREAVQHFCENEWAVHLDDVMIRRTSWHYYHPDAGALAEQSAEWMALHHGWDASRRDAELDRYRQHLRPPDAAPPQ